MHTGRRVCNGAMAVVAIAIVAWLAARHGPEIARACAQRRRVATAERLLARGEQLPAVELLARAGGAGEERLGRLLVSSHTAGRWPGLVVSLRSAAPAASEAVARALLRSPEEHLCAAEALAALGDQRGVQALGQALLAPSPSAHPPRDLLDLGAPGVEALANVARCGPPAARGEALLLLAGSESPAAVRQLIALAEDTGCRDRPTALRALAAFDGPRVAELLREGLGDSDPAVRAEAARQWGAREGRRALDGLAGLLEDDVPAVRRAVVETLGLILDPQADEMLIAALSDSDARLVRRAACLLGQRECHAAEPALERAYARGSVAVRRDVATALCWMNSPLCDRYRARWERQAGRALVVSSEWDG